MEMQEKLALRDEILEKLASYGIEWSQQENQLTVRDFRAVQRQLAQRTNFRGATYQSKVAQYIAKPSEIKLSSIQPRVVFVDQSRVHTQLWAYATSHWSIPVTPGYGRRIRYFLFDKQNDKLIGIVGLCDPVIGLTVRDRDSIGWTKDQKIERLYNCMTAYLLGALPPYDKLLGAKLVASSVMFPEVQEHFNQKYRDRVTTISKKRKKADLVYIDTLGAFGKSAIYTRLRNWEFIGYTKGESHLHITANGSWELFRRIVPADVYSTYSFGKGPNWKLRVLKAGLHALGLSDNILGIGWKRAYYRCPLATNWREYLLGDTDIPQWLDTTPESILDYWRSRWLLPRESELLARLNSSPAVAE